MMPGLPALGGDHPVGGVLVSMTLQGETPVGVSPGSHWDMTLATSLSFSFLRSQESLIVGDSRKGIETAYLATWPIVSVEKSGGSCSSTYWLLVP